MSIDLGGIISPLYVIVDVGEGRPDPIAWTQAAVAEGAALVQLRAKKADFDDFVAMAVEMKKICTFGKSLFIVNDNIDAAVASGADGVHLGQSDAAVTLARQELGDDKIIGWSTHNPQEVGKAIELPVDYVAVGPVFPTTGKENPDPVIGCEGVRRLRKMVKSPLVAIGGITVDNAGEVLASGADLLAVIGDIASADDQRLRCAGYRRLLSGEE